MHRRLGEILVDAGVIDAPQLKSALAESARGGRRVGEILIARGLCTEEAIVGALSDQLGVPVAPLATTTFIPEHVLGLVPARFARERLVLPLFLDRRQQALEVAVADPSDHELLDELRFRTGHAIRPLVALPGELAEAIERFYFGRRAADEAPDRASASPDDDRVPGPPAEAPPVVSRGAGAGADEPGAAGGVVRVERRPLAAAGNASLADPPGGAVNAWPDEGPTLGDAPSPTQGGLPPAAPGPATETGGTEEILRRRVEALEARVAELYGILREAAAAHRTLVSLLDAAGHLDAEAYRRAVRERLDPDR